MVTPKIRLYVDHPLGPAQSVALSRDQAHYLFGVMRLSVGGAVLLFNGRDGEWHGDVVQAGKRGGEVVCATQTAPLQTPPDLTLIFAPIKKARTDFIVEKAAEMGARRIVPVQTAFTNAGRVQRDRLQAHAIEAAEQCGGTFVPQVAEMAKLDAVLAALDDRQLMFCDEAMVGDAPSLPDRSETGAGPWAILIGPEGGFSDAERKRLRAMDNAHPVSLGPRILRADTAVVAAMTLWQQHLGDWR